MNARGQPRGGPVGRPALRRGIQVETHAIGEQVEAFFQPSRASLFDAETGFRL